MNNFLLKLLPWVFRVLPIPGWLVNKVDRFLNFDIDYLCLPLVANCRSGIQILIDNPRDLIQRQLYFQGYFEYRETLLYEKLLRPGMTYLDVGANIGWHTLVASRLIGPNGVALAFEPVSNTFMQLKKNINLNNITNVELFNFALSDSNGNYPIYPILLNNNGSNSLFSFDVDVKPIEFVETKIGAEVLNSKGINTIDFCKIDVEGAEVRVIEGLDSIFKEKRIKNLVIELNEVALKRAGSSAIELVSKLCRYGYNITDIRTGTSVNESAPPLATNLLCTY